LLSWVDHGTEPPPSRFPSRAAGTLLSHAEAAKRFPAIPGFPYPRVYNGLRVMDYGAAPPTEGAEYTVFIAGVDSDGNGVDGGRHPLLLAPVASHTGWNLRAPGYGDGELFSIYGSMLPFAATAADRQRAGA